MKDPEDKSIVAFSNVGLEESSKAFEANIPISLQSTNASGFQLMADQSKPITINLVTEDSGGKLS